MSVARRLLGDREFLRRLADARESGQHAGSSETCKGEFSENSENSTAADTDNIYREVEQMVDEELAKIAESYQGGLFISTGNERFRMERIREICSGAARAMAEQLSSESLLDASFEEAFGRKGKFEPVTLEVDGETVYVEGKIDRSDILSVDGSGRVRIIDYKT
jgi:ATP-dependent helicase/DNAse subunit B